MKEFPNCLTNLRLGTATYLPSADNLSVVVVRFFAEEFSKHDSVEISLLMFVGIPLAA